MVTTEDCLFLSVYTPERKQNQSLNDKLYPVVFWIHGGSLLYGCGMFPDQGPERIMMVIEIVGDYESTFRIFKNSITIRPI